MRRTVLRALAYALAAAALGAVVGGLRESSVAAGVVFGFATGVGVLGGIVALEAWQHVR
ncbi:hypothetical protein [Halobaculum sp. MBLA0143]|uniref:hypothetical protein n=1 Tax=Halobaculum sp. MBLA0143 TaxID=3079933 RepID=UPI00352479E8